MRATLLMCVLIATLFLSACNTMHGLGQDIQNGGRDLSNAASKNQ